MLLSEEGEMTTTIQYSGTLIVLTCWCGIKHAVPKSLRDEQLRQHNSGRGDVRGIYCPLGHTHIPSGESATEKLERTLKWERERSARLAAERDQAEASARGYKGAATRARNRAKAGVCPRCNRTFSQLSRHMETKHPDFDPEAVGK